MVLPKKKKTPETKAEMTSCRLIDWQEIKLQHFRFFGFNTDGRDDMLKCGI